MPNRVKNGVRPSASNSAFSLSPAALAARAARQARATWSGCGSGSVPEHHDRVADKLVDRSAFGEERLRQHREIPRRLPHQHIGIGRLRDRRKSLDVGEDQRDLLFDAAEPGGDGIVDDPADDLLGNEMRERPDRSLREIDRVAEFVNLPDMRGNRHQTGLRQRLKLARLRRNAFQRLRHRAAEHPDDRNKGRASDDREDEPIELQLADVLDEVILGRQQQYAAAISFAEGEFRQPEQIIPAPRHHGMSPSFLSRLCDLRRTEATRPELISSMLGNCDREGCVIALATKCCKIGMGDERARLVEDHDRAMLSRPLGLDEIAEGVELEIGGEHAGHFSPQAAR